MNAERDLAWPWTLARYALVYAACVAGAALLGRVFATTLLNFLFLFGALAILLSGTYVRTGSEHGVRLGRGGAVLARETSEEHVEKRKWEIGVGMRLFLFGLALWVPALVARAL